MVCLTGRPSPTSIRTHRVLWPVSPRTGQSRRATPQASMPRVASRFSPTRSSTSLPSPSSSRPRASEPSCWTAGSRLGNSIRRWLPELSSSWQPVQLHHLLAHCGGLGDSNAVDARIGWGVNSRLTTWARFGAIAATEPESAPGAVHRYNNHGYVLLAMVVERSSGETLGSFARHALFAEAGMTDSRFLDTPGPDAVPGWIGGSQRVDIQFTCCGDGGLVTSLADLARWDAWLPRPT